MLRTNQRSVYDNVELQEKIIRLEAEVSELSQTACSLSSRVEELDNTKCALQEAQDLAQSVITMHDTIHICKEALATNNIDDAAKAIARIREIRRMYPDIYKVCDNASLKEAKRLEDEVCSLVRKAFDNAIISGDKDGVSKCGRLFYPLGMTTEAVARYVRFIRQTLAAQCKQKLSSVTATTITSNDASSSSSSNVINEKYVNTLTDVFLAVADIIQDHQRNIEEQFGPINFIMVLRGLQSEVDIQAIAVIKRLRESRSITTIMEHFQTIADECIDNNDASSIVDEIDLGEKDAVIDEICIIAQRCNQFDHYIHNISRQVVAELGNDDKRRLMYGEVAPDEKDYNEDHHHHKSRNTYGEDGLPIMTDLTELVQELMGEYVLYERSFIIVSTIKAFHEDRIDMDDPQQMTSSVVDDVFFVLNKAIRRSLSSDDIDSACAVMNHIVQVLSNEYKTICLDKPLQESKRNFSSFLAHREYIMEAINDDSTAAAAAAGGGGLNNRTKGVVSYETNYTHHHHPLYRMYRESDGETPLEVVSSSQSWPHALSNVALSALYVDKLRESATTVDTHDKREMFLNTIQQLDQVRSDFDELTHLGCKMCLHQVKIQYLSPALAGLDNINYDIDEDGYNDYQINDPFAQHFINETDIVIRFLTLILTQSCMNIIIALLVDQLTTRMEKFVLSSSHKEWYNEGEFHHYFSMLGAIQFDQDIRRLLNYFTSISDLPIRRKFSRLLDMCTLLSLESLDEFHDLYSSTATTNSSSSGMLHHQQQQQSSSSFRLSKDEIKKILFIRRFPKHEIDALLRDYHYSNNYTRNNTIITSLP